MYLDFFNLREFPFSLGSDERFFFESSTHAEALASMLYTVQQRKGMVLITGVVGAGKTFVSNVLAVQLGVSAVVSVVRHPPGSAKQLLRSVAGGLGVVVPPDADKLTAVEHLAKRLRQLHARGRLAVVVLDEVQDLPDEALEEVRLIWNCEQDGQRALQIVLVGQPELRQRLADQRWESLRQRIVLACHLGRLDREDAARYIQHRLRVAENGSSPVAFSHSALDDIHAAARGVPRLINVLCDNALLAAYTRGTHQITREIVEMAVRDMTGLGLQAREAEPGPARPEAAAPARPGLTTPGPPPAPGPEGLAAAHATSPAPAAPEAPPSPGLDERILEAALQGQSAVETAREAYRVARPGSLILHLAIRVIVRELIATLRTRRSLYGRTDAQNGNPPSRGGDPPLGGGNGQDGLGVHPSREGPSEVG